MRYLLIVFLGIFYQGFGQNLIPNPYFNHVRDCSSNSARDFFENWYNPTSSKRNRPYHTCLDNIPYTPFGVNHLKFPKRGEGMLSVLIYYDIENDHRSYTASRLKSALVRNTPYYIRFYVSPKKYQNGSRNMVADAVGLYLSTNNTSQERMTVLPYQPQIEQDDQFFDNYDRWYRVQGKYMAIGGENVALIGNFRTDLNTRFKYNNPSAGSVGNIAEIFIDDVLIEAFDPLPDTILLCDRSSLTLNAGFHEARYQWNTGAQDSMITVNRSGKYKITATIDTLVFEDYTQVVFMDDFSQENTIDTFLCEGSGLVLQSPVPGSHQWSTGE